MGGKDVDIFTPISTKKFHLPPIVVQLSGKLFVCCAVREKDSFSCVAKAFANCLAGFLSFIFSLSFFFLARPLARAFSLIKASVPAFVSPLPAHQYASEGILWH